VTDPRETRRLVWQKAELVDARRETASARTLVFSGPDWTGYLSGQHVDVRLTAEGGYSAERSYSIAAADKPRCFELTVQRLPDGEVSPYFVEEMAIGDEIEVRGPIGGWFAWGPETPNPVLLVGGGSGVVPLMAMLRLARRTDRSDLVRLVVSVRSPADLYYAAELPGPETVVVYTRRSPPGASRAPGRLTGDDLPGWPGGAPTAYVCGSTGFADHATNLLLEAGIPARDIRVERFGPTG
jgi:ferredoxin-NADP reductase